MKLNQVMRPINFWIVVHRLKLSLRKIEIIVPKKTADSPYLSVFAVPTLSLFLNFDFKYVIRGNTVK